MKGKRLLTAALAGILLLGGCTPEQGEPEPSVTPTPGAEMVEKMEFVLPCYPSGGFHPITGEDRVNLTLSPLLYRGLFALDRQFQPREELCDGYTVSETGLVWTFQLAPASFSDGSALTAEEVAASLNLARQSGRYATRLAAVTRVTAEEGEVTVTLSQPNGALPALLDVPIVKETEDPLRPLGTGPYYLTGTGEELALTARSGAKVPLDTIPLRAIRANDDLVYAFDAQEVSLVDTDLTGSSTLGYSGRFEAVDYSTTGLLYLGCNTRSGACKNLEVRQALARAVDREHIAGTLLAGHAAAAALPVHPDTQLYDKALAQDLGYDPEAARTILSDGGWQADEAGRLHKGRSSLTLRLLVNQDSTYKVAVAEYLAGALEQLGCGVTVEKLPWDDFVNALKRGNFDLYLGETVLTADFDLETLLGRSGGLNYGGYNDGPTQELLSAFRAAAEPDRPEAAGALCARVGEMAPVVPLCFKNGSLLTQWGQIQGASPTQRDAFAGLADWVIGGQ